MSKFKHSQLSSKTRRNIFGLYLVSFFNGTLFWYAIEQLFIEDLGGGVFEKGLSVGMFVLIFSLINIPIGAFADRYGRRLSLVLGLVFYIISLYLFAISPNVYFYILMNIPIAFSVAFFDGAVESMVYDSLADDGREKAYSKVIGILEASVFGGAMLANIASGFIANEFGLRSNYYLSLAPLCLGLLVATFLIKEPKHHIDNSQSVGQKVIAAIKEIKANKALLYIIVAIVALFTAHDLMEEFSQPLFTSLSTSAVGLSLFWAGIAGAAMVGQLIGHSLRKFLKKTIILSATLTSLLLLVEGWFAIALLPIFFIVIHSALNALEAELQDNSKSHLRSTIGSVYGTVIGLVLIPAFLFSGALGELIEVNRGVAVVALPFMAICIWFYWRYNNLNEKNTSSSSEPQQRKLRRFFSSVVSR